MGKRAEKRTLILNAAEDIMSEKGLTDSSISEIARRAGVTDSVIYQHFKGKEDLLFSIASERMRDVLTLLKEHLQGIQDAESRLRKMVWFHLNYNDTHPGYARLLLLECRSCKDFYSSDAYQLIREYSAILYDILKQGVDDGVFRGDMSLHVARGIILGALDMENIGCLAAGEAENSVCDFESLASMIRSMIAPPTPIGQEDKNNKAEAVINAALKVFAEKGFSKAKISEIAELAGVADGTVYEYFESKEDLLLSIPVGRYERYLENLSGAFEITHPARKLRRLIMYHFLSFLTDRHFLKVFLLELQLRKHFYGSKAFESFKKYYGIIEDVVKEGIETGAFRPEVNPRVFRNMFLGAFSHMALRWLILKTETETDMMEEINQAAGLLYCAVTGRSRTVTGSLTELSS
jgi:TetR/AcrR family fatty acid metabolism transcriptional regulator